MSYFLLDVTDINQAARDKIKSMFFYIVYYTWINHEEHLVIKTSAMTYAAIKNNPIFANVFVMATLHTDSIIAHTQASVGQVFTQKYAKFFDRIQE